MAVRLFPLLLIQFLVPCSSLDTDTTLQFVKMYTKKWPHCANLGTCPKAKTVEEMQTACLEADGCVGFSFTTGDPDRGGGCLKRLSTATCVELGPFGDGSHDYYSRVPSSDSSAAAVDVPALGSTAGSLAGTAASSSSWTFVKLYTKKWPHCANLGTCPKANTVEEMQTACLKADGCVGFSFTTGDPDRGGGCLKRLSTATCVESGPFGDGSHDYYSRVPSSDFSAAPVKSAASAGRSAPARVYASSVDVLKLSWQFTALYFEKWPHCFDLGECFKSSKLEDLKLACLKAEACVGFTFTAGKPDRGAGCLKQIPQGACSCVQDGPFGELSYDYYAMVDYSLQQLGGVPSCGVSSCHKDVTRNGLATLCTLTHDCAGFVEPPDACLYSNVLPDCLETTEVAIGSYYSKRVVGLDDCGQNEAQYSIMGSSSSCISAGVLLCLAARVRLLAGFG